MEEPIRVLHVFGRLDSGGAESRTMDIYREIDRQKVQFDFAIHTNDNCFFNSEIETLGGRIYCFPRFSGKNFLKYKYAWSAFFKKNKYQIIHGHQTSTAFVYLKEAKKNGVPIRIAHSRNSSKGNFVKNNICKLSRLYATNLFAVSEIAAISEFGGKAMSDGKVTVIPNAIDTQKYSFNPVIRKKVRKELRLEGNFAVVHIGRFHPQKNHLFLLEVFKEIRMRNQSAKLVLIGDGFLREEIKNIANKSGLEKCVIFTGIRADVPNLLQGMDVLLFPSLYEGLPGVVLEAQAAGVPCVVSDTITTEVKVTELVKYVSLDRCAGYWAKQVLDFSQKVERKDTYDKIVKAGYDIKSVSEWYKRFYISSLSL